MRPPCPPFSPCWCEQNPTNPRCSEALPISSEIFSVTISLLTIYIIHRYLKNKLKDEQKSNYRRD